MNPYDKVLDGIIRKSKIAASSVVWLFHFGYLKVQSFPEMAVSNSFNCNTTNSTKW